METSWLLAAAASAGRWSGVVAAWLLTYLVHSTALILLAWWLVTRERLRWSPAAQATTWRLALVAGFFTSSAQVASPWISASRALRLGDAGGTTLAAVRVSERADVRGDRRTVKRHATVQLGTAAPDARPILPVREPSEIDRTAPPRVAMRGVPAISATFPRGPATDRELTRVIVMAVSLSTVAVLAWALVAAGGLAHLVAMHRRLGRALEGRRDASDSLAGGALRHLRATAGVRRAVALSASDAVGAPAALSGDEIVVPWRALRDLSLAEQEGVLAHELAHVVRHDTAWLRLAVWVERAAWFQPLNRMARRRMQLAAEFAADAWAVQLTRQPVRLAQALARVADWLAPPDAAVPAHLAPGADGSPLVERVRRLTAPSDPLPQRGTPGACAAMALIAALGLVALPRVDLGPANRVTTVAHTDQLAWVMARDKAVTAGPFAPAPSRVMHLRVIRSQDASPDPRTRER